MSRVVTFGLSSPTVDLSAKDIRARGDGSTFMLAASNTAFEVVLPLLGDFNVTNALGAAAAAWALGTPLNVLAQRLSRMPQVPGRLERVLDHPVVLRDYAHTPDALERALEAVRPFAKGRIIVVFGCGGDRDRGKRPLMGAIAESKGDVVIVTSDNPRTEHPERILDDIERGMTQGRHERIEDRRAAIVRALVLAEADDVVLLAGKGHETYQVRGTTSHPFDERVIVRELAEALRSAERTR
jgi:UDP-N-acetylmuramoyl-L-alanyl-D-glutamate--2,6-diaminopimelate ligase